MDGSAGQSRHVPQRAPVAVGGPQALLASELPRFLEDLRIVREAYQARLRNAAAPRLDTRER